MHGRLFVGLTILTTALLLGCGGGNLSSTDGSATSHAVAAGDLGVFPATLNFGKVTVGTKKALSATLTAGNARIIVRSADWGGPGFSIAGIVFPLTVPAGQSAHFKVTFAPKSAGQVSGNIKFVSNADNSPHAIFNGNGTADPCPSRDSCLARSGNCSGWLPRVPRGRGERPVHPVNRLSPSPGHLYRCLGRGRLNILLYDDRGEQEGQGKQALQPCQGHGSELLITIEGWRTPKDSGRAESKSFTRG